MLEFLALVLASLLCLTHADDQGFYITPNNTKECANDLIKWCNEMKYPQEGAGMSMISVSINDRNGYMRILCTVDSEGTNCTKNGSPWFSCSKDNVLSYKGNQLREDSDEGTDQEICETADRAFNDLMVQNLSYDNETIQTQMMHGMESFFEQMARMQEQIEALQRRIFSLGWDNNPFLEDGSLSDSSPENSNEEESSTVENELEKE